MEIFDGHFRDSRAGRTCQRRDEPVQLAVKLNFLNDYAPVGLEDVRKNFERIVLAPVVHKHQLVRLADSVHHFGKLHVERWDVFLFIEERNDNGILDGRIAGHSLARYLFYASWDTKP